MSWSYTPGAAVAKDQIRLLVGDTRASDQQLQDEEIAYAVTIENGNTLMAAARCAEMIGAFYARDVTTMIGKLKVDPRDRQDHYSKLAATLRDRALLGMVGPLAPATTKSGKQALIENGDGVLPFFFRSMDDNPFGSRPSQPDVYGEFGEGSLDG